MYWFFNFTIQSLLIWLSSLILVSLGGWLFATHLFDLKKEERVLIGLSLGLVTYLWLINILGRWFSPFSTYFGCAVLVFLLGLLSAYHSTRPIFSFDDWKSIAGWLAAGFVLFWIFLRVSKGTGLYDEYKNLALISTLANGRIPELQFFGQDALLRYHYGFHYFGAGMMQLGHFMPWSAFDLSKAIIWSLSLLLTGLVGKRYLSDRLSALWLGTVVALQGGTRYLLLLLPSGLLAGIAGHIKLRGIATGPLITALASIQPIQSAPKIGYPFAFLSDINPSYVMAHSGERTIEPLLFMLAILLIGRPLKRPGLILYAILFSFWALASEPSFGLFAIGWGILVVWKLIRDRATFLGDATLLYPTIGLLLSIPVILVQGGVISAIAQQLLVKSSSAVVSYTGAPIQSAVATSGLGGFSLRWPPAIVSGQLGPLPLTDPATFFVGILEMGIVVVLLPWLTYIWWRKDRYNWLLQLMVFIAWTGLLIPLVVRWESEQDIAHITDFGVDITVMLLVFLLIREEPLFAAALQRVFAYIGSLCLVLMCIPGLVLMGIQITAAQDTVLSEHYGAPQATLVKETWGKLPTSSKVLGPVGMPSILTGQLTAGIYNLPDGPERPMWEAMLAAPRLNILLQNGFDFVFVDHSWWYGLDATSRQELQNPCIHIFAKAADPGGLRFVELLDLRKCR